MIVFVRFNIVSRHGDSPTDQSLEDAIDTEVKMLQQIRVLRAQLKASEKNVELLEKKLEKEYLV